MLIVSPDVFSSMEFQSQSWYQGCSGEFVIPESKDKENPYDFRELKYLQDSGEYVAEPKLDGNWDICFWDGKVERHFSRSRSVKDIHIEGIETLPAGTALVGEVGRGSQYAVARRSKYGFEFMDVWELLFLGYEDYRDRPSSERRYVLNKFWNSLPDNLKIRIRKVERLHLSGFCEEYARQHEGLILKKLSKDIKYYGDGDKVPHWIKIKKWFSDELVLCGWEKSIANTKQGMSATVVAGWYASISREESESIWNSYANGREMKLWNDDIKIKKNIIVDGKDLWFKVTCRPGTGNHELAMDVASNFEEKYLGRVMEFIHFGLFNGGSMRHPSPRGGLSALREDKNPEDCIFRVQQYEM